MVSFQDSKVEWLGKIPKHWLIAKLKNQCQIIPSNVDKKSHDNEIEVALCNYVDVYRNDFINCSLEFMIATANEHELKKFQLIKEDVLITKDSEDPYDIAVPALVVETQPKLLCGYHLSIIRSNNQRLRGSYLFWVLRDASIASQLHRQATGITRWAIATKHVKNSSIPLPPLSEQQTIATYLDKNCAAIDKAIEAKQKQLEILDALRKSIIHKAVTRGLDDSVELKDSGIEWIGKIPKHWGVKRIKRYAHVKRGASPRPIADQKYFDDDGEYAWVRIADVSASGRYLEKTTQTLSELGTSLSVKQNPDDLFISIAGTVGKPIITKIKCCIHDGFIWFDNPKFNKDFLYYIFLSEAPYQGLGKLGTQLNLNTDTIGQIFISVPSKKEQRHIVDYLDEKCSELTELQANIEKQISTLEQYRKSLIHECITGKRRITEDDVQD